MTLKAFGFVVMSLSLTAFAQTSNARYGDPLVDRMFGVYAVGECSVYDLKNGEKVVANLGYDQWNKTNVVSFVAYSKESRDDMSVRLGKGVNKATSSGGTETWETVIAGETLTLTETYERKGASSWPDLGYTTTTTFTMKGDDMQVESVTKRLYGHAKDASASCTLTSLKNDPNQIATELMADISAEYNALAPNLGQDADYDQATVQFETLRFNKVPSKEQIQEVVGSLILPQNTDFSDIEVVQFTKASKGQSFAERALATVIGIAKDRMSEAETPAEKAQLEAEYAPLFKYVEQLAQYLDNKRPTVKVYLLNWSASDSDGSAVLIIDTETNEAVYIGAYYFS